MHGRRDQIIMRAVLQRVLQAQVEIVDESSLQTLECRGIGQGLMVLLGVMGGDTPPHVRQMAKKVCEMRIFEDEQGKLNRSLLDVGGEMLVVSNFTLGADCKKGTRPSFSDAASPVKAIPLYEQFVEECRRLGVPEIKTGEFGAAMKVSLVNDGPVTIILDSDKLSRPQ